jgi:hypothetical protein
MNIQDKKKELHYILDTANDELTNVLMEAAIEYQTKSNEEFVVPQEWIDEAEEISRKIDSGEMKTCTIEESLRKIDDMLKSKRNAI